MNCGNCGAGNPAGKRFCGDCGAALLVAARAPADVTDPGPAALGVSRAERRPLTVMFCDLVESTALSTRIDPEDFSEVIGACHRCIAECVARFGGFVARYVGDGVLVFFGYPQAHEDDAERAVRAALDAVAAVSRLTLLQGSYTPRIRVGIATGLAVVGDLLGTGTDVAGESPNLAARLHAIAEPGTVLIAASTRRLLGHQFEYRDLGRFHIKGFGEPVGIVRILGARGAEGRFRTWPQAAQALLFGRDAELTLLREHWETVRRGQGRVVLLTGEPGIGKSRLSAALQAQLGDVPHIRLRYFCSPYHVNSALQPLVEQLERGARFTPGDDAAVRLAKLTELLGRASKDEEDVALIADLLAIPSSGQDKRAELSPQVRKERVVAVLLRQLTGLAAQAPVLLVAEDAHWADPTSRDLLDLAVEAATRLPVFVLVAARPEFRPAWAGQPHVTTLALSRFSRADTAALISGIVAGKPLPPPVVDEIATRSDGIPLFVEEMTKAVLEGSLLVEGPDGYALSGRPVALDIPDTLHASLMARLGPPSLMRELALIGATIGRDFSHEMLAAVAGHPEPVLREALRRLCETELIYLRGRPPQAVYSFKHALVRDAAYGALLRDQRRQLHARIGEVMQTRFPDLAARQPAVLAHHFAMAGMVQPAIAAWANAARLAAGRWAMAEAAAHLEHALDLLDRLPDTRARQQQEMALQTALGNALIATKGYTAPRTGRVYDRARALCEQLGDSASLIRVANGQWSFHLMRAEVDKALSVADDLRVRAEQEPTLELSLAAQRLLGASHLQFGRLDLAREHLLASERILAEGDPGMTGARDASVAVPAYLSIVLALGGAYDDAYRHRAMALDLVRRSSNPHRLAFALGVATVWFGVVLEDHQADLEAYDALTEERDLPFWRGFAVAHRGIALARAGDAAGGLALVREGEAIHRGMGACWGIPQSLGSVARFVHGDEGLALVDYAIDQVDATGVRWFAPELVRIKGQLLAEQGTADRAEACFQAALQEAGRQRSRHWALRIAFSLASLWRGQGRLAEAATLLRQTCAKFDGAAEPDDLARARALLRACTAEMAARAA